MSKKTKIFYLIERIARAGTELHLLKLLSGLDRERYEPVLCVLNGQMSDPDLLPDDIRIHDLKAGWNLVRPSFVGVWRRLIAVLKEEQPDILHSFLFVANAIGPFAARRAGVPFIIASRGRMGIEWDAGAMHRHLQAAADKRTDRILCKTTAMRDEILEYEKVAPEKIEIVPNGVDLSKFTLGRGGIYQQRLELQKDHGIKPDGPLILALGNLKPIKGHEVLLRSAPLLSQRFKAYQIVILGEGEARPELENQIEKLRIG
ncbi:MAG: glycosyltransferase, partial [Candidatus Sumerlaeota bacterium]